MVSVLMTGSEGVMIRKLVAFLARKGFYCLQNIYRKDSRVDHANLNEMNRGNE